MEQRRTILDRIALMVDAKGSPTGKITTYVTRVNVWSSSASDQKPLRNEYFKVEYPANTLVEIIGLGEPEDRFWQK